MKASVVVRTHNNEATVGEVLEAVFSQSFREDFEVVVVDSGSTDRTLEILRRYPHVFVDYSKESFNYGGSLNAGISAAKGEYAVCLSSHCVPLEPEWLAELVGAMDAGERLAAAWGTLLFDVEDYPVMGGAGVETIDLEEFYRRPNRGLQNPNSVIRRSLWEERPFSEKIERCEDQDWAHHFLKRGYRTAVVHGARALYRVPHGPYSFGRKTMRDFVVLNELFGHRANVPAADRARRSGWLARASILGKKSPRVSTLMVASMTGRWAADKAIRYRRLQEYLEAGEGSKAALLGRLVARKAGQVLDGARRTAGVKALPAPAGQKTRFFLVGEMRSGTSWLQRTLNSHPEIFCKGEGSFFGRDQEVEEIPVYKAPTPSLQNAILNAEGIRTWHDFTWNGWGKGDVEEDLRNLMRLTVDYFMEKDSAASGKRIVGDKSPLHTDHVDEIHSLYPEAKVVHIYRDGRDVAVSLMHHFWRLSKDKGGIFDLEPEELEKRDAYLEDPEAFLAAGNSIFTEERLRQMAVRWSRRAAKASGDGHKLFGEGFFQLSYEDLLSKPEENLKAMFELLGARSDEATVRRCVEKNSFEKLARRRTGQEDSSSFFRKGVAGDWRGVFTEQDRRIYEDIAGDTLQEMGYSLD
jgi:glycosyltransferase involved in cell wall biosynthesis